MIHILLFPLLAPCRHHFQADNTNICSKHCCPGMDVVGLQIPELWVLFERNWPPISPVKVFFNSTLSWSCRSVFPTAQEICFSPKFWCAWISECRVKSGLELRDRHLTQHMWSKYILSIPYTDIVVYKEAVGYVAHPLSSSS